MTALTRTALTLSAIALATTASAQSAQDIETGTELIAQMADKICIEVSTTGSASSSSVDGEANAELGRLGKRLLDLGIEGAGELEESEFSNILRKDLAAELKDNRRCREQVFNAMFARVFGDAPEVVLTDAQQESLAGRVRPHSLNIMKSEDIFAMAPGDTVAIKDLTTPFSIRSMGPHANGAYVDYSWTDARNSQSASSYQYQSQPITISNGCTLIPFQIDLNSEVASFTVFCK